MESNLLRPLPPHLRRALASIPPVVEGLVGASHLDVKTVRARMPLASFVPRLLSYRPFWLRALFALREPLARALRLNRARPPGPPDPRSLFTPGTRVPPFVVRATEAERYWVATVTDVHLDADLAVIRDAERGETHVATLVRYHDLRGQLYFTLIRPFHHLVVGAMARHAARGAGANVGGASRAA